MTAEHAEARGLHVKKLCGTQFRKMLRGGEEIPEWFAFKSVVEVLRPPEDLRTGLTFLHLRDGL